MTSRPASVEILTAIGDVPAAQWDRLARGPREQKASAARGMEHRAESISEHATAGVAQPSGALGIVSAEHIESLPEQTESSSQEADSTHQDDACNPFIFHAFLEALEASGSVGGRTGWTPLHLLLRDEAGDAIAAMPCYAKSHSRGEYVFDHAFAEAMHRAGGRYYPKLQVAVPFTPASARKFLIAPEVDASPAREALLGALETLRARIDASSIHATFLIPTDRAAFNEAGYLMRQDQQFHFLDRGYGDFEGFLNALASRKRKTLKRERRAALEAGISVEWVTGPALTEAHWDAFYAFYMETGGRKWGTPYLTREFFSRIGTAMPEKILLVMARRAGRYIAGALNFIGANTLYGRNWGAIEHHPFLHFELCYYQAIDFALAHGLERVEAGAQGEHKLARGYEPVITYSAHSFADAGLHRAVSEYLIRERAAIAQMQNELEALTPFRRGED
ncbi:MAG: GNAT family N-acetyltransferase [Proteobacteria bacterium]|nr:GNAT family N-acetyltransferase [Pseudomonadota bacterium]